MITLSSILQSQTKYGVNAEIVSLETITYESYLLSCRTFITDVTPLTYQDKTALEKDTFLENVVIDFVQSNVKSVIGFTDENGELDQDSLIKKLNTDILQSGILRNALEEDDDVEEIQINDFKTIFVVKKGKAQLYCDPSGTPYQFVSNDELRTTLNGLINDATNIAPLMNMGSPILNARTCKHGYRVSATDESVVSRDRTPGYNFPITAIVIRKKASVNFTLADFESRGSIVPKMSRLARLIARSSANLLVVGPVFSGKTTFLNALAQVLPLDLRILAVQNPTEIELFCRSMETGANLRNVVHWEAQDKENKEKSPTVGTMSNLMSTTLRFSPDITLVGEMRTPEEIAQYKRGVKMGNRILSTLHAYDGKDALSRMGTDLAELGGTEESHVVSLAGSVNFIFGARKFGDGRRVIRTLEESTGKINPDGTPEIRVLFRYTLTGKVDKDADGKVTHIHGYFEHVNPLSEEVIQRFYEEGVSYEELREFIEVPDIISGKSNIVADVEQSNFTQREDLDGLYDSLLYGEGGTLYGTTE